MRQSRPLMAQLYSHCMHIVYPTCNCLYFLYYFACGRKIVATLDSMCSQFRLLGDDQKVKRTLLYVIFLQALYSTAVSNRNALPLLTRSFTCTNIFNIVANFINGCKTLFGLLLFHFIQYLNLQVLGAVVKQIKVSAISTNLAEDVFGQLSQLASANRQLHRLLSFPMFIYFSYMVLSTICTVCISFFYQELFGILSSIQFLKIIVYSGSLCSYVVYIVYLNHQALRLFDSFTGVFRYDPAHLVRVKRLYSYSHFKYGELTLYRNDFKLQVFYLNTLNLPLIFSTVLLILSYVVFIFQTN